MIKNDAPDMELLYYMSEKDTAEDLAREAFQIFLSRHYANLVVSCRKSLAALTHGRPLNGLPVDDVGRDLASSVMSSVYDGLCKKFTRAPKPGTEAKTIQCWLARIAKYHALRAWKAAIDDAMGTARPGQAAVRASENDEAADPITDFIDSLTQDNDAEDVDDDAPAEKAAMRALLTRAWQTLSEQDRQVIKCSAEHDAGWALGGHATREHSKQLAELFKTNPVALRQRRKRALDKLKKAVARIAQLENDDEQQPESNQGSQNVARFERRRT